MNTNQKRMGMLVGLAGVILTILTLFLPYAKAGKESKSLIGIAKLYIESDSGMWNDKQRETFYKIFVPLMLGLIVLFAIIYLIKCMKLVLVQCCIIQFLCICKKFMNILV